MGIKKKQEIPRRLAGVQRRIERWRQRRKVRESVPDKLWDAAVRMARVYGVSPTAQALRLNYDRLKKRVEQHAVAAIDAEEAKGSARFVELAPVSSAGCGECCVELEDGHGAVMRVRLQGIGASELATLTRAFLNGDGQS